MYGCTCQNCSFCTRLGMGSILVYALGKYEQPQWMSLVINHCEHLYGVSHETRLIATTRMMISNPSLTWSKTETLVMKYKGILLLYRCMVLANNAMSYSKYHKRYNNDQLKHYNMMTTISSTLSNTPTIHHIITLQHLLKQQSITNEPPNNPTLIFHSVFAPHILFTKDHY
jgi:hypothetical protein